MLDFFIDIVILPSPSQGIFLFEVMGGTRTRAFCRPIPDLKKTAYIRNPAHHNAWALHAGPIHFGATLLFLPVCLGRLIME